MFCICNSNFLFLLFLITIWHNGDVIFLFFFKTFDIRIYNCSHIWHNLTKCISKEGLQKEHIATATFIRRFLLHTINLLICVYVYNYKSKAAIDLGFLVVGNTVQVIQEEVLWLKVGYGICKTPADFENTQLKWSYPLFFNADSDSTHSKYVDAQSCTSANTDARERAIS